jgi:hypothetical protein
MLPETLPVNVDLPPKFTGKLDQINALFDRYVAQHLFEGDLQLAHRGATSTMTKKIYVEKKSGSYVAPARYRKVEGKEATELWTVQVYKEYWHTMWLRAKSMFNVSTGHANEIKRRIGDYDENSVGQIEDQHIRAAMSEMARHKAVAASALKDANAAEANMNACRSYLISVAEAARKAADAAEIDARDRALVEEEARREKAKAIVKRELAAAKA